MKDELPLKNVRKMFLVDRFDMQEHALQESKEKEVPTQPLTYPNVVKSGGYTPCRMDYIIDRKYVMTKHHTNRSRKRSEKAKNESMSRSYQKGEGQGEMRRKKACNEHRKRSHKGGSKVQQAVKSIPQQTCGNQCCTPLKGRLQWREKNVLKLAKHISDIVRYGSYIIKTIKCLFFSCNPSVMSLPQQEPQVQEVQMPVPPSDSIKALNGTSSWSPIGDPKTFTIPLQ